MEIPKFETIPNVRLNFGENVNKSLSKTSRLLLFDGTVRPEKQNKTLESCTANTAVKSWLLLIERKEKKLDVKRLIE